MTWARLDDGYFTHRKVVDLSKDAKLLDLAAIAYCARELTDGDLRKRDVLVLAAQVDIDDVFGVVTELLECGRWQRTGANTWRVHDYLDYNPSREQVLKERATTLERVRKWRGKRKTAPEDAPNGTCNAVTTEDVTPYARPVNVPVPFNVPVNVEDAPNVASSRASARAKPVDDAFLESLETEFSESLGSREAVKDTISAAMSHKARLKYTDQRAYLRNWLRRDVERMPIRRNGHDPPSTEHQRAREEMARTFGHLLKGTA